MKCATCGQDLNVEVCGHVLRDPKLDTQAQLALLRQSLFQPAVKPQAPAEQPKQNKS